MQANKLYTTLLDKGSRVGSKTSIRCLVTLFFISLSSLTQAYHIDVSVKALPNTSLFLAGYYGERVSVIDSVRLDADGRAVFKKDDPLCPGIYTLVVPGQLMYDFLLDSEQRLSIDLDAKTQQANISHSVQTSAYASYLLMQGQKDKGQLGEQRKQLIDKFPNTFLATYLTALQPVDMARDKIQGDGMEQMRAMYQYRRRHFFDNMHLSDIRMLHTPLYHEKVQFYISKFVTQQADSLIHNAYRLLELASDSYETFFYMSDFLIDFSLRSKIDGISKLHHFLQRNRYMYGTKALPLLPAKSRTLQFMVKNEALLQNQLKTIEFRDTDGQPFDPEKIKTKFRIFYFWKPCPRCLLDVAQWQSMLNKYQSKSCFGIAVNTATGTQAQENRILPHEPLCVNVSMTPLPKCAQDFYSDFYSKIIVTDTTGSIIGIFASSASLDDFFSKI